MDVKVPEIGESIQEALVAEWLKKDGETVAKDDNLCELETDKINVEVPAEADGVLHIKVEQGETVKIGAVIATIEEGAEGQETAEAGGEEQKEEEAPSEETKEDESEDKSAAEAEEAPEKETKADRDAPSVNPAAKQLAREKGVDLEQVEGTGRNGRVTLDDVRKAAKKTAEQAKEQDKPAAKKAEAEEETPKEPVAKPEQPGKATEETGRPTTREAMTPIRQRIAARLLEARQQTAMLTTFNEADMTAVKQLRARHQEHFSEKHGVKLGLMSFFVKACVEALKEFPAVNARIDDTDIVYHHYYDIGIAVGTDRGLVVPVLRDADQLSFAEIEQQIAELAEKAQQRKLSLADLEGGTFTITNGGVYGSLLSTPIINPPQCGVLGMHAIQDRPVVRDGEVVIRPIMNLALSYDHRLIDGREAVSFLKLIKEYIEDPEELLLEL